MYSSTTTDNPLINPHVYTTEQTHLTLLMLRRSWGWLRLLAEPGRASSPTRRPISDDQAEALAAAGMQARAYREINLRRGLSALAPARAPARIDILDAQTRTAEMVAGVVVGVVDSINCQPPPRRGHGVVDALDWLDGAGPRWVGTVDGMIWRRGVLDDIRDVELVAWVDQQLQRADRVARAAAGVLADPVQPLADRCPACRRRSLQLNYDADDVHRVADGLRPRLPSLWWVQCVSDGCKCTGIGCGCQQRVRMAGRPHAWAYGELAELWRAVAATSPPRRRLRRTATGRGWGVLGI